MDNSGNFILVEFGRIFRLAELGRLLKYRLVDLSRFFRF